MLPFFKGVSVALRGGHKIFSSWQDDDGSSPNETL